MTRWSTTLATISLLALAGACDNRPDTGTPPPDEQKEVESEPPPTRSILKEPLHIEQTDPEPVTPLLPFEDSLSFADGGTTLGAEAKAKLDELLATHDLRNAGQIVLRGHSDSRGGEQENLRVSERRAQAVADYLVAAGIDAGRLTVIALGAHRPVVPNVHLDGQDDPEGRARNRRVDISILPMAAGSEADDPKDN